MAAVVFTRFGFIICWGKVEGFNKCYFFFQILFISCEILGDLHPEFPKENRLLSLYLHLLLTFTGTNTWKILRIQSFEPLKPSLNKLTENVMGDLVSRGLYSTLNVSMLDQ